MANHAGVYAWVVMLIVQKLHTSLMIVLYSIRLALLLEGIFKSPTVYYEISSRRMAASCTSNLRNECNNNRHEFALKCIVAIYNQQQLST